MAKKNIVEMKQICKEFPGVKALTDVDIDLREGEVHALVGENGAGKSTIIKILMGVYQKTSGEILVEGKHVDVKNPMHAQDLGLGAVYQDVNLAQHLSIAENFFMDSIEVPVEPTDIIHTLSVAQQEMVAIGKMLHQKAKVVIFDEPTALLTNEETEELFKIIHKLKENNVGILYISHRMEEILQICDRATVLKDGRKVGTVDIDGITEDELISMMVGRDVEDMYGIEHVEPQEEVLNVENISRGTHFKDVSFSIKKGEIFGMFGLVGSGRTEIVRSIFGADIKDNGNVIFHGKDANFTSPAQGIEAGIALLPENRKEQGLALKLSVSQNTNMVAINKISKLGFIDNAKGAKVAQLYCEKLRTKTPSVSQLCKNLSGGNQQKVVISKWLAQDSELFIFDEPTVGVDVGAKVEIYKLFESLVKQGKTIIVISSYLPEVAGLSDRMLVMYEGRQMGILKRNEYNDERILRLASGIN